MKPYYKTAFHPYEYKRNAQHTGTYGKRSAKKLVRCLKKAYRKDLKQQLKQKCNL